MIMLRRQRSVLTTVRFSNKVYKGFSRYLQAEATTKPVLTRDQMSRYRSPPGSDVGHAVVLIKCDPVSLTFLNSWGRNWGYNGSFSVQDYTVLQWEDTLGPTPVRFYDVFWLDRDLSEKEQQAYSAKPDETLQARAEQ
ncbi:hypothetical protein B0J18DRAFT_210103 [Chaetomium sp. MPI-SDFR-AT-0129]|nr:hypothetical protein B0J18DRAFT_210103 [Chaetomium sp. MPI-SDFR-AT-0129]